MSFTIYKLNHLGEEVLHYSAEVVERGENYVCLRAMFGFETRNLGYVTLKKGDIFTEWFYTDRWYNVFKVEDIDTGQLKGYYCNITRPAVISETFVKADDLALDIFVHPNGKIRMLDEDEYDDLPLSDEERRNVHQAIQQIEHLVQSSITPFHDFGATLSQGE